MSSVVVIVVHVGSYGCIRIVITGKLKSFDNFALEVLQTASAVKKIPGKDFFLVGYDNQSWTERAGLTTIQQPMEEMGRKAAELIINRIEEPVGYIQPVKFLPFVVRRKTA